MSRNPFGWDYPAGAEHDPSAPWNQRDVEAIEFEPVEVSVPWTSGGTALIAVTGSRDADGRINIDSAIVTHDPQDCWPWKNGEDIGETMLRLAMGIDDWGDLLYGFEQDAERADQISLDLQDMEP